MQVKLYNYRFMTGTLKIWIQVKVLKISLKMYLHVAIFIVLDYVVMKLISKYYTYKRTP